MADDLDDFLRQAALRREQRQQKKTNKPIGSSSAGTQPPRRAEVARLEPEVPRLQQSAADQASMSQPYQAPYQATVGSLGSSLPSSSLPPTITPTITPTIGNGPSTNPAFQRELSKLRSNESKHKNSTSLLVETPATQAELQPVAKVSSFSMVEQLRDPKTLRMAIIAHEVLKRPWE
jgi:hypothetical protein